jgi:hypothetical protein
MSHSRIKISRKYDGHIKPYRLKAYMSYYRLDNIRRKLLGQKTKEADCVAESQVERSGQQETALYSGRTVGRWLQKRVVWMTGRLEWLDPQRYQGGQRAAQLVLLAVVTTGMILPVVQNNAIDQRYALAASEKSLVGNVNANIAAKVSYNPQQQLYQFNKSGIRQEGGAGNPVAQLAAQAGGAGKKDTSLYSVDLPIDLSQGLTYYDNNMEVSFRLIPQFKTLPGREEQGRLVYPLVGGGQIVYSFKANGLKEDVVLNQAPASGVLNLSYQLALPNTLQARLVPGTGEVGVYSADPALFGNISFGSNTDQSSVMKARVSSPKNNLVFVLPPPVIKQANSQQSGNGSRFVLRGTMLSVVVGNMEKLSYPLSIDPSIVITSSADFGSGNNEGMISYPSGQINRGSLTGATVSSGWSATTSLTTARSDMSNVAYNGFMYNLGGYDGTSYLNDVQYAPINANGTIGTWTATASFTTARKGHNAVAYNGYMYILGGYDGTTARNDVQYAPINANGTIGTWTATASFTTARAYSRPGAVYNGYLYVLGGWNNGTLLNDVQYAPINADGTVGTWVATTSFTTARLGLTAVVYSGYLYIAGGFNGSYLNDVQYAPINNDGSVGSWMATTSFTTGRYSFGLSAYSGYLYIAGGFNGSYLNDVQYAPINANGTIGTWAATASFTTTRYDLSIIAYKGYLYIMGGIDNIGTQHNDIQYALINPAGVTGSYTGTTNLPAIRSFSPAVAYNGYLYVLGGQGAGSTYLNDVQYAPINANGTIGTWAATASFTTPRYFHSAVAYNGYMYIMGGNDGTNYLNDVQYAPIGALGLLGSWFTTTNLPTTRFSFGAVVYGGNLYIMGGFDGTTLYNDVQYAPIGANGTLGTWTATTSFTTSRDGNVAVAYNGYLYVLGGQGAGSTYLNDVQYAPINANGTIGSWTATTSFTTPRSFLAAVAYNGYMYIMGGNNGSNLNDVQYAPINNDDSGSAGTWTATTSFSNVRSFLSTIAYNGYLYVMGGWNGTTHFNDVQYAPINANGTIGTWAATASFTNVRRTFGAVAYNGYLYIMGGYNGTTHFNDVQYAPINANGTIGTWAATASFTTARRGPSAVAYNGYMYILGGYNGTSYFNDVQYAPINANGTIGSWTTTTGLPFARYLFGAVAYNGHMYVMGGYDGTNSFNDTQYTTINANGTLIFSSWTPATSFTAPRNSLSAVAYNGYMYILGGQSGSTYLNDVQYAPINANGTIGSWTATTNFTTGRFGHAAVIYNGYFYVMGGVDSGGLYYNDVQYAPINTIPRVGHYSKLIDLGISALVTSITYNGSLPTSLTGLSAINYRMAGTNGVFGATGNASSLTGSGVCPTGPNAGRYIWVNITLDDRQDAAFPDINGSDANVTDFTVNYSTGHPPPNLRLRGGAWFSNQSLQPLDTCTP